MIQVYTGNGKGKSTAAFGLALRAAGAGKRVYILQFLKGRVYSELNAFKKIPLITVEQFGGGCFINKEPQTRDYVLACSGLERAKEILSEGGCDLLILDEINIAEHFKLIKCQDIISLLKRAPKKIEVVLTGRFASPKICQIADLVSDIKDQKHYYKKGIKARKGIEF